MLKINFDNRRREAYTCACVFVCARAHAFKKVYWVAKKKKKEKNKIYKHTVSTVQSVLNRFLAKISKLSKTQEYIRLHAVEAKSFEVSSECR